jgi:ABC-2 type transport system permease protein
VIARCFTAVWRSAIVFVLLMFGGYYLFDIGFMFSQIGFALTLAVLTMVVSMGVGILISALIVHLGVGYGFLSWSLLTLFMLLSAPFFPMTVFPEPVLSISKIMPYTWIFESVRNFIASGSIDSGMLENAAILSVAYFSASFPVFSFVFRKAKEKGRLIRLWE